MSGNHENIETHIYTELYESKDKSFTTAYNKRLIKYSTILSM